MHRIKKTQPTKHYNNSLRPSNLGAYTWQELNCFYRPFALSMGKNRSHLFLFLISMYMTHTKAENSKILYNRLHPALSYFEHELESILKAEISPEEYSSEKNMHRKIEETLTEGYAVIVPYDLYLLPYSQNYMEQHHRHYLLVKGFDSGKAIYYLLDNMQNALGESTSYTDFMMEYHRMYLGADSFHRLYDTGCSSCPYFWKVKCSGTDAEVEENVRNYLIKVLEGFTKGNIKPYYVEQDMLYGKINNGHMLDMVEQINQRNVYYGEFMRYLEETCSHEDMALFRTTEELKKNWNLIKIQLMRGYTDIEDKLLENIELENGWHKKVLGVLKQMPDVHRKEETEPEYHIINELNAGMRRQGGGWEIRLSPDMVYDTWELKDDACQILYPLNDGVIQIEAELKKTLVTAGDSFHMGIILKSQNGKKILYGNSRNIHLAVFQPGQEQYELYQSDYGFEDTDRLKVELFPRTSGEKGRKCTFSIMNSRAGQWKEVYSADIGFHPEYAGIFVKSWERCECAVTARMKVERKGKFFTE